MRLAFLFDLDGTLLETDDIHYGVMRDMLAERGYEMSREEYDHKIMGHLNLESFPPYFPGENVEEVSLAKEVEFRRRLQGNATPVPGLRRLLDWADDNSVPMAIVTNAPRANAEAMLGALGITERFSTIVIGEECERAKPDPFPYQEAMRRLSYTPNEAAAFEDSGSGMRAARGSGAYAFGMRSTLDDHALRQAGAHTTLKDFEDSALWDWIEGRKARA